MSDRHLILIKMRQTKISCTFVSKLPLMLIDWWFSPGTPVFSTNKTDCQDITEILLKVALNHHHIY
jgi:hypothetical protein